MLDISEPLHQSIKYRIFPSKKQERKLNKFCSASKTAYNFVIELHNFFSIASSGDNAYSPSHKLSPFEMYPYGNKDGLLKTLPQYFWLRDVPVEVIRSGIDRACNSIDRCFKKLGGQPRFKKYNNSFSFNLKGKSIIEKGGKQFINCVGKMHIPLHQHKILGTDETVLYKITISKEVNQWFASLTYEICKKIPSCYIPSDVIGIDEGIETLITLSSGDKIKSPLPLKRKLQLLKRRSRQYSKSKNGSNRKKKKRFKLSSTHRKIKRTREIFSKYLGSCLSEYAFINKFGIVFQDVNISGMMQSNSKTMSRNFSDVGIYQTKSQIKQQCERKGIPVYEIPRFDRTTGCCPNCMGVLPDKLPLSVREWTCPTCKFEHDRDTASAKYIRKLWLLEHNNTSSRPLDAGRGAILKDCPTIRFKSNRLGLGHRASNETSREEDSQESVDAQAQFNTALFASKLEDIQKNSKVEFNVVSSDKGSYSLPA